MKVATVLAVALLPVVAGCGGDDDEPERTATARQTETEPRTATEREETETEEVETEGETDTGGESPEDQPGGAGDEEPASSQALFTGRGGRIRPRLVRVPPFIAVRIELRSADGRTYAVRFGRRTLRADAEVDAHSARFDGLRPGESLVGLPEGGGPRLRVEASAEPGP